MPACSQILEGIISSEAIKTLVNHKAGRRVYIPQNLEPTHPISQLIGFDQAQSLSQQLGGEMVFIPKKHSVTVRARNLKIVEAYIASKSVKQIATAYKMTDRNIRLILNGMGVRLVANGNKTRTIIGAET